MDLADDVVEVSLFGSGYGECCLIHLGGGAWMMIDSLLDESDSQPALGYLQELGYPPEECVRLIVASHWDDDHTQGLAAVLQTCTAADFACASIFSEKEYLSLQRLGQRDELPGTSGFEFVKVFELLGKRAKGNPPALEVSWCSADRPIWTRPADGSIPAVRISSLTPSNASISMTMAATTGMGVGQSMRSVSFRKPNHCSVVIWASIGDRRLLLGADLDNTGHAGTGWNGILASTHRDSSVAEVFKVPHHGSPNAWEDRIWTELLTPDPVALVAPWSLGGNYLPQDADRERICAKTTKGHLAAPAGRRRARSGNPTVDKLMSDEVSRRYSAGGSVGRVTARAHAQGDQQWEIIRIDPAEALCRRSATQESPPQRARRGSRSGR